LKTEILSFFTMIDDLADRTGLIPEPKTMAIPEA